jgi:hypothetical protein
MPWHAQDRLRLGVFIVNQLIIHELIVLIFIKLIREISLSLRRSVKVYPLVKIEQPSYRAITVSVLCFIYLLLSFSIKYLDFI